MSRIFYVPAFRALSEEASVRLRFVVDASEQSLSALEGLPAGAEPVCASCERFLSDRARLEGVQAVIVALPHHLHEPVVCRALEAGLHVLCEKPVALDGDSLARMLDAARRADRVFAACQIRRHYPAARAVKDLIDGGMLGACGQIDWQEGARYGWPAESLSQLMREHGGEELFDMGAHVFDCLAWWLGPLEVDSYADDSRGGAGADFRIGLRSEGGTKIHVRLSRIADLRQKALLKFENGVVTWRVDDPDGLRVESAAFPLDGADLSFPPLPGGKVGAFAEELRRFGAALMGEGEPTVPAAQTARYVAVFDQCNARRPSASVSPVAADGRMAWPWANHTVAVTGAAGFIGCRLVEMALERGLDVRALVHQPMSCARLARNDVPMVPCDVMEAESIQRAAAGASVVFHCAYGRSSPQTQRATIVDGTQNVLRAAAANGAETVVILSSMLAYGDPPLDGVVTEVTPPASHADAYGRAKADMERRAFALARQHGLHVVILAPTCVFGPFSGDFAASHVALMQKGRFFLIESGRGRANLVYVDNLVDAMLLAATTPEAAGRRFIVNEEQAVLTWAEYFAPLYDAIVGGEPPTVTRQQIQAAWRAQRRARRPTHMLRQAVRKHRPAGEMVARNPLFRAWKAVQGTLAGGRETAGAAAAARNGPGPTPRQLLQAFVPNRTFVNLFDSQAVYCAEAARTVLGWQPAVPPEAALQSTVQWVRDTFLPAAEAGRDRPRP